MLINICLGWLICGLISYFILRHIHSVGYATRWTNRDRFWTIVAGIFFGPVVLIFSLGIWAAYWDGWDKPAKW